MLKSIRKFLSPLRVIVLAFTLLIAIGTLLLNLPSASQSGTSAGWLTALFTSTSASCVTGLVLVDTATHWTIFGQIVILLLIQTGGLGIVTLSVFFISLMGRKIKLKEMLMVQESLNHFSFGEILKEWKKVVSLMFAIELAGTLLLCIRFIPRFGLRGIYVSLFHAVSAFCNAGFDILGTTANPFGSLTGYVTDPLVTLTIAFLIILGGLGYIIWQDVLSFRREKRLSYHTRVMLIFTTLLLVSGTLLIWAVEYDNPATMANLTPAGQLNASFFQSVTSRTAGYNSIDQTNMNVLSKVVTVFLMFIGGGSGSTAGGVKVTTLSVVLFAIFSQLKGKCDNIAFKHRISFSTILKAMTIIFLSFMLVLTVSLLIVYIEQRGGNPKSFIDVLFETTSAFGTVGLSSVKTFSLNPLSHLLLILCMFLGKVGPLSFFLTLTMRASREPCPVVLPEGKVVVG